ncbi:MAG: hypothetical protein FWE74_10915 [Oscillospiraceae bacterium]|nr:hypothetical protein [Oscillospiraceae bacterium]
MEDVIISVDILPEILHRRIRGEKVKVQEADGIISLIPLESTEKSDTPLTDSLIGILEGAGVTCVDDIKDMRLKEWL